MRHLLGLVRIRRGEELFHRRSVEVSDFKSAHQHEVDRPPLTEPDAAVRKGHVEAIFCPVRSYRPSALACREVIFDEAVIVIFIIASDNKRATVRRKVSGLVLQDNVTVRYVGPLAPYIPSGAYL